MGFSVWMTVPWGIGPISGATPLPALGTCQANRYFRYAMSATSTRLKPQAHLYYLQRRLLQHLPCMAYVYWHCVGVNMPSVSLPNGET